MRYSYTSKLEEGQAISFSKGMPIVDTVYGVVLRGKEKKVVWSGTRYNADAKGRASAKRQVERVTENFRAYNRRIGRCWYDDSRHKKLEKEVDNCRAMAKARALNDASGAIWAALRGRVVNDATERLIEKVEAEIREAQDAAEKKVRERFAKG